LDIYEYFHPEQNTRKKKRGKEWGEKKKETEVRKSKSKKKYSFLNYK